MSSPLQIPGAKRTLILALVMSLLGLIGVTTSIQSLVVATHLGAIQADPSTPLAIQEASRPLAEAFNGSSVHHAMSVGDLLASALLLLASFALTGRTRTGIWWATQALLANVVYTLAAAAGNAYLYHANRELLVAFARAVMTAQGAPLEGVGLIPPFAIAGSVLFGVLGACVYLVLLRLTRREDVRRFVAREV